MRTLPAVVGIIIVTLAAAVVDGGAAGADKTKAIVAKPPPAFADDFKKFCRDRPAGCASNYGAYQAPFLQQRTMGTRDRIRERERLLKRRQQRGR